MLLNELWDIVYGYLPRDECQMVKCQNDQCVAFTKRQYWKTNDPGWVLFDIFLYDISIIEPLFIDDLIPQEEFLLYLCHERLNEKLLVSLLSLQPNTNELPFALIRNAPLELLTILIDELEWIAPHIALHAPAANRFDVMQYIYAKTPYYRGEFDARLSGQTSTTILDMIYAHRSDKRAFLKQVMQENGNVIWVLTKTDDIDSLNLFYIALESENLLFTDLRCFQWFVDTYPLRVSDILIHLSKDCLEYFIKTQSPDYTLILETGFFIRDLDLIDYALPFATFEEKEIQIASCRYDNVEFFKQIRNRYPSFINDIPLDIVSDHSAFSILHLLMKERQMDIFDVEVTYKLQPQDIADYHIVDDVFLPHCTDLNKMYLLLEYMANFAFDSPAKNANVWTQRFFEKHFFVCIMCASTVYCDYLEDLHERYPLTPGCWELVLEFLDERFRDYVISGDPRLFETKRQNRKRSLVL